MAYSKTTWENNVTPISAANLNNLENGVEDVDERLSDLEDNNLATRVTDIEEKYVFFDTEETWSE